MNNAVNILQEGSMMKALTKLGIPIVIAMLIMAIYNVVDTFWVARLGTLPVAAVSVIFPLSLVFLGIGLMFGVGSGVYISRLLGAKQVVKAGQVASVSVITSVILAALIAFVCNAFLPEILLFMGANEEMMSLAEAYGRLFIVSCVIGTLNVSMSNIIVSQGASKTSASAMIIGSIINVALDPLFIYAFGWGVEGAAWATILSRIITTIIYLRFFMEAEVKVSFTLFVPTIRMYLDIIKIGISMLCLQLLQTLSISLLQRAAVKYGAEAVAAVGIVLKIVTLGTNVVFGFVKGLQPMAGYNYGAENFQRLKEAVRCSLILTTSFCVLWSTFILVFASPVIRYTAYPGIGAEVAIINLKTNQVEKVIKDDRVGFVGLFRHTIAFTDELGDIYFYSLGMEGNNPLKDGFVRIKNGTDEWDKDYHFQLSKTPATGIDKPHSWILYYHYAGNGIVYACVNIPSLTTHDDPMQSSILDFNYQPVKIDVRNKTIEKINLPLTTSMGCFTYGKWKDEIVFGMTCKEGTGYYTYNPTTGACSPKPVVTTVGVPSSLLVFE